MKTNFTKLLALVGLVCLFGTTPALSAEVILKGSFDNWQTGIEMTLQSDKNYHAQRKISKDDRFKIYLDGNWYGSGERNVEKGISLNKPTEIFWNDYVSADNLFVVNPPTDKMCEFIFNASTHKLTIQEGDDISNSWSVNVKKDGSNEWTSFNLIQSNSDNIWIASISIPNNQKDYIYITHSDGVNDTYYGKSGDFGLHSTFTSVELDQLNSTNSQVHYTSNYTTDYVFIWDSSTKKLNIIPTIKAIYSNASNEWQLTNPLNMILDDDGCFYYFNLEVPNSYNGYGYVQFCTKAGSNNNDWSNIGTRFGSEKDGTKAENGVPLKLYQTYQTAYQLTPGHYDIKIDLSNGTSPFSVTFTENENVTFNWWTGADDSNDDARIDHQGTHVGTCYDSSSQVQLGVGDNSRHDASKVVNYTILYRPKTSAKNVIAYAETDNEGYVEDEDAWQWYNEEDNIINLLKVGDYKISAELPEDQGYHTTSEIPVLYMSVEPKQIILAATPSPAPISFSNTGEYQDFINLFALTENNLTDDDFTVTFEKGSEGSWIQATAENGIQSILGKEQYAQYEQIANLGAYNIDGLYTPITEKVTVSAGTTAAGQTVYNYSVSAPTFPCSGVYVMTIAPAANSTYTFEDIQVNVTVTPNLTAVYGYTTEGGLTTTEGENSYNGLNINGIPFSQNSGGNADSEFVINYPMVYYNDEGKIVDSGSEAVLFDYKRLKTSQLYTPGYYLADELTIEVKALGSEVSDENPPIDGPSAIKAYADDVEDEEGDDTESEKEYLNGKVFDLSNIQPGGQYSIIVNTTKNGAPASQTFLLSVAKEVNANDIPTGIEAIGAEGDGEAVYYNLQGVRVENPQHGIYVKVANGKASKVVIR